MKHLDMFKELKSIDFKSLDLSEPWNWPRTAWFAALVFGSLMVLFLGYVLHIRGIYSDIELLQDDVSRLKIQYRQKSKKAQEHDQGLAGIKQTQQAIDRLLSSFPESHELPSLVDKISELAMTTGLMVQTIRIRPEQKKTHYVALPIEMDLIGDYHQMGSFMGHLSQLARLITVHDLNMEVLPEKEKNNLKYADERTSQLLKMSFVAKTYRNFNADEWMDKNSTGHK